MSATAPPRDPWLDAQLAAELFAGDPLGQAIVLRAPTGPVRQRWLDELRGLLPAGLPVRQLAPEVPLGRLLGELDLAATLQVGRPLLARGILAEAHGGIVILSRGQSMDPGFANIICSALDSGSVRLERDSVSAELPASFGLVILDEGCGEDEIPPATILDRCALRLDLSELSHRDLPPETANAGRLTGTTANPHKVVSVVAADSVFTALCQTAMALGIVSLRAPQQALRIAKAAAALSGRSEVEEPDLALACRLVYAPQARCLPPAPPADPDAASPEATAPEPPGQDSGGDSSEATEARQTPSADELTEIVLAAALAAIPPGLLEKISSPANRKSGGRGNGRASMAQAPARSGRPLSSRPGDPRRGARLDVIATLRAAAPWQSLRRQLRSGDCERQESPRLLIQRDDFRVKRYRRRSSVVTIFAVDASGSAAVHRLAETKGAIELLLGECYVRRDRVALIAFRGRSAELLLPPTRSLVRAKRQLSALPGGGGTPLALGIEAAVKLADDLRRHGESPGIVLLTDGRANVTRAGIGNREEARREALAAAECARRSEARILLVDTAPQAQVFMRELGNALAAQYLSLPHADAGRIAQATQALVAERRAA